MCVCVHVRVGCVGSRGASRKKYGVRPLLSFPCKDALALHNLLLPHGTPTSLTHTHTYKHTPSPAPISPLYASMQIITMAEALFGGGKPA